MKIRDAQLKDVPAMTDNLNWAITNSTAIFRSHRATVEEREALLMALKEGNYPCIVAEDDKGKHLGWALYKPLGDPAIWHGSFEDTIYIAPDAQGQGVGSALLGELMNRAQADERVHTMVALITSENEASIALHRKMGFDMCGTVRQVSKKFDQWIDLNYMQVIYED